MPKQTRHIKAEDVLRSHPGISVVRRDLRELEIAAERGKAFNHFTVNLFLTMPIHQREAQLRLEARRRAHNGELTTITRTLDGRDTQNYREGAEKGYPFYGDHEGTVNSHEALLATMEGIQLFGDYLTLEPSEMAKFQALPGGNAKVYDWMRNPESVLDEQLGMSLPSSGQLAEGQVVFDAFAAAKQAFLEYRGL